MGNWNTSSSDVDAQSAAAAGADYGFGSRGTSRDTGDSGKADGIAFISPSTGRGSTGNWNVRQAREAGVQSAVIDGRTLYGSNRALAALGDPSSQFRENVIAGYPAYMANKQAEQRFMDNWIGKDLTSRIREAADAAGIPRSEIPFLSGGVGFDEAFPNIEEGTAIRFSAGEGDKLGLEDERSFGEKVGDFFADVFEGKPERDLMFTQTVDPETGLITYSPTYQVVNDNNWIDAIASRVNPLFSVDTAQLIDPVTRKEYAYSDPDVGLFGFDLLSSFGSTPRITDKTVAMLERRALEEKEIADRQQFGGGVGSSINIQSPETFETGSGSQSLVPRGRDPYQPILPLLGTGFGFPSSSFYTSSLPSLQYSFGLLR